MGDTSIHLLPYFHGLLPREDLIQLLKMSGDFVIRSTEPRPGQQRRQKWELLHDDIQVEKKLGAGMFFCYL
uniref:SH2 domain-containing protein n=1 Tax=Panagrolaimus sp. PS1159 TaxID=55785 RepID=A0AC35G841_9BILA